MAGPFQPADEAAPMQFPAGFNPYGAYLVASSLPGVPTHNVTNDFVAIQDQNKNQNHRRDEEEEEDILELQHGPAANNGEQQPFYCLCGAKFTHTNTLKRHIKGKGPRGKSIPCPLCEKYDVEGFSRRDNLTQHLKRYHKVGKKGLDLYGC